MLGNVALGMMNAARSTTVSGQDNIAIGYNASYTTNTGLSYQVAIGRNALRILQCYKWC